MDEALRISKAFVTIKQLGFLLHLLYYKKQVDGQGFKENVFR